MEILHRTSAKSLEIMWEQIDYLMEHADKCRKYPAICDDCARVRDLRTVLMRPHESEKYPKKLAGGKR